MQLRTRSTRGFAFLSQPPSASEHEALSLARPEMLHGSVTKANVHDMSQQTTKIRSQ